MKIAENIKSNLLLFLKDKIYFAYTIVAGLALGASFQYNWALDHNFWKDFKIRIILGPPISALLLLFISLLLIQLYQKSSIKTVEEYIKKQSTANLLLIIPSIIFIIPEIRFNVFLITFVLFMALLVFFFHKEFIYIMNKLFPKPPVDLDFNEQREFLTISIKGDINSQTVSYLYDSQLMEEEGLFDKKIFLDLKNVDKIDEKGLYWIIHLIFKAKMAGMEFDLDGNPELITEKKRKKLSKKDILAFGKLKLF